MTHKGSDSLIKKLVKSDIKANRSYNAVIFVTIITTVCLMMIMPMFFQGKILEAKKDATGRWQAAFALVDSEIMDKIKENPNIEAVGISFLLSEQLIEDYQLNTYYMNEELRTLNKMGSLQGTVPQTDDEIMVTSNYLKHVGMEQKTGQKIKLDIGDGVRREYSISGILPLEEEKRYFNIYTSHVYMNRFYKSNLTGTAYFRMKEGDMITTDAIRGGVYDLAKDLGVAKGSIVFSTYYFMLMEKSSSSQFLLVMAVNTIILLACALVIYSVFYIAITERVKDYGKLHIIGATRKQIKRIIKKEKIYFFSIAAPAGLLLGSIAGYLIIPQGFDFIMTIKIAAVVLIVTYMICRAKPLTFERRPSA